MDTQGYRANYIAAFESANDQLDRIYEEYHQLQLRKENLEEAVTALEPFLQSAHTPAEREIRDPEPIRVEAQSMPHLVEEPVRHSPEPVSKAAQASESVVPAAYAPVPEVIQDPIQRRINSALGLAVA